MPAKFLEGKPVAEAVLEDVRRRVASLQQRGVKPGLGTILVGDDGASAGYVRKKHETCESVGIVSFHQALKEFEAEGGQPGRGGRYADNCRVLIEGMRQMGFTTLLPDSLQAPIIVTFHMPKDPKFVFQAFYDALKERGYVIYPGKLTVAPSFRIGCIGHLGPAEMRGAIAAIGEALDEMGVAEARAA